MSLNNLNNKRARDEKNIVVTLAKTSEGYIYFSDSLNAPSKIMIPLDELPSRENLNQSVLEISDSKKEKIEKTATRVSNGTTHLEDVKSLPVEKETVSKDVEEIPVLAKLAEKNFKTPLILPSCSQWFRFDDIHELETKALPEFFCNKYPSKSPEVYKEYRNYIINLYRENSSCYLTATSKFYLIKPVEDTFQEMFVVL
jgi:hypothetical protein